MPGKSTKRTFYIVDLVRDRKLFTNLDIPPIRVNVTIEVEADVPKAKMDRMEKAARDKLEEYEDIIVKEATKFNTQIENLLKAGKLQEAIGVADSVNNSIKGALRSAEGAANMAVEAAKKKEAQGDKLLLEARVKTVVGFVFGAIKIATSVARIGASHGGDVHAWLSLGKDVIKIGLEIHQQLKKEPQLRKDLVVAVDTYLAFRKTVVMEAAKKAGVNEALKMEFPGVIKLVAQKVVDAAKLAGKDKDPAAVLKGIGDFVLKGVMTKVNDAEKTRKAYREQTTIMRHKVDDVSAKGDKLFAEMKKQTTLKEGVKIGAQCMQIRGKATQLGKLLDEAVTFLENSQKTLENAGLNCDDQTMLQKIAALDKATIFEAGSSIFENISAIKDLVDAVS